MRIRPRVKTISTALLGAASIATLAFSLTMNQVVSASVPGTNTLVSVNNTGNGQGGDLHSYANGDPKATVISSNGRYIAFRSDATNLVSNDTNGRSDIFFRDLNTNVTTRINVSSSGVQANNLTDTYIAISATGRYVTFASSATNLIDGQTQPNSNSQLYLRDTVSNTTTLLTQTSSGVTGTASGTTDKYARAYGVSSDGRFVLFASTFDNLGVSVTAAGNHTYLLDRSTNTFRSFDNPTYGGITTSGQMGMSCDGSLITIQTVSRLTDDDTDGMLDIYLVDLRNGTSITNLTSASSLGMSTTGISCNGDYIPFESTDNVFDTNAGVPSANTLTHSYIYDRTTGTFELVDKSSSGTLGNNSVTNSSTVVDDYGNAVFASAATNLSPSYSAAFQLWLHNHSGGTTELVSKNASGTVANNGAIKSVAISANGKIAAYSSSATNLIGSDTNGKIDIFASLTGL